VSAPKRRSTRPRGLWPIDAPFLPRGVRLRWCAVREAWFLLGPSAL
jgi:hypothetical protein